MLVLSSVGILLVAICAGGGFLFLTSPKRRYLAMLRRFLREMPFIYEGNFPSSVVDDYVDAEYEQLALPGTKNQRSGRARTLQEMLRDHRRVLILGNAGMGKTTFERYSMLQLIDKPGEVKFLNEPKRYLPVFIPLKAIDNSERKPILRYLTSNIAYFSGPSGLKRLHGLANEGHLLICLDGYDEIPLPAGATNHVRAELNEILSIPPYRASERSDLNLINCRIWLSSRREFFANNPISEFTPSSDVVAVTLTGVGERRLRIIKTIFDRYERGKAATLRFLDPEYFLASLDLTAGDDMVKLSHNPLFLTVLCYIYATEAIARGTHDVPLLHDPRELILTCVNLLISDLDENKARDLSNAKRAALLLRRNTYVKEKVEFLKYYAYDLLIRQAATFDLVELKKKVRIFFTDIAIGPGSEKIISEMDRDSHTNPHFALQLIYCGVFTIASMDDNRLTYDFAHRRFREVLASEYVTTPERYLEVIKQYLSPGITEFLGVFQKSERWKNLELHLGAMSLILSLCLGQHSDEYIHASNGLVSEKPIGLDISQEINQFLLTSLEMSNPTFRLSNRILWSSGSNPNLRYAAENALFKAWQDKDVNRGILAFRVLRHTAFPKQQVDESEVSRGVLDKLLSVWVSCAVEWGHDNPVSAPDNYDSLLNTLSNFSSSMKDIFLLRCAISAELDIDSIAQNIGSRIRNVVVNALLDREAQAHTAISSRPTQDMGSAYFIPISAFQALDKWIDSVDPREYQFVQSYHSRVPELGLSEWMEEAAGFGALIMDDRDRPLAARSLTKQVNYFAIFEKEVKRILSVVRGKLLLEEEFESSCTRALVRAVNALLRDLSFVRIPSIKPEVAGGQPALVGDHRLDVKGQEIEVLNLYGGIAAEVSSIRRQHRWDESAMLSLHSRLIEEQQFSRRWCEFFEDETSSVVSQASVVTSSKRDISNDLERRKGTPPTETPRQRSEVYVSYAWCDESSLIIDQLQPALRAREIELHFDKRDVKYRDSINAFMAQLGRGKCVVLLINRPYLLSPNCMRELLAITEHGEMRERVFPIVFKDANIFNPMGVVEYVRMWEAKKNELDKKLKEVGGENLLEIHRELDLYTRIRATFSSLSGVLRDMNALSVEEHMLTSFQELVTQIEARIGK